MEQNRKTPKMSYNQAQNMAEKLFDGYKNFVDGQNSKLNLKQINELDYQCNISAYEDQLFYYQFAAWEYELKQALRQFKKSQIEFINFDKAKTIIEEINSTPPKKKRVNYRGSEITSQVKRIAVQVHFSMLLAISKQVPVHPSGKGHFPIPPQDLAGNNQK